ncbi:MAG: phage major capsid protein [Betaproteobacteria bacterium]|nr:phage major capsid protein [Betaproteobacteria bacterium]
MIRLQSGVHGTLLAVLVQCLARANGNHGVAAMMAKSAFPGFPSVAETLGRMGGVRMDDVPTGDTTTAGWASELSPFNLDSDFIEAVRARTIIDRLNQARRAPFLTNVPVETGPASGAWVGAGEPIPVGRSTFTNFALAPFRCGVIVPLTRELIDSLAPAAIVAIRESLIRGIAAYLDSQFLDPSVAAVTDVSPASITNALVPVMSSGTTAATIAADLAAMLNATADLVNPVWIANARTAAYLALTLGREEIKINGGTLLGIPLLTTQSSPAPVGSPAMPRMICLLDQDALLVADDGQADVAVSTATALSQQTAPSSGAQSTVSLFQTHAVAVRTIRRISWRRTRTAGVVYMEVNY